MGLEKFDLKFEAGDIAMLKGFYSRTDSYVWGILSQACVEDSSVSEEACNVRKTLSAWSGVSYSLLTLSSLLMAATLGMLVLSSAAIMNFKTTSALYASACVVMFLGLALFELKLKPLMEDPSRWSIHDHEIRTSMGDIDAMKPIPAEAQYAQRLSLSRIIAWVSFGALVGSFLLFVIRVVRTRRSKKYLYSLNSLFTSRPSVFFGGNSKSSQDSL